MITHILLNYCSLEVYYSFSLDVSHFLFFTFLVLKIASSVVKKIKIESDNPTSSRVHIKTSLY